MQADYLKANPIKLIKQYRKLSIDLNVHKEQVWDRMLEIDEWQAVQKALVGMPEKTTRQKDVKMRTQFLVALLYLLGLRIHEVTTHTWANFKQKEGKWWFFAKGKGGKLGHIPVNEQLWFYIKAYRVYCGKSPEPESNDTSGLILSTRTGRSLGVGQLYNLVKAIGRQAANFFPEDLKKQKKLHALSPHWLRHLAASHQDKLGFPPTMIQENLRHQSPQTTQIYLHSEDRRRSEQMEKMQMQHGPSVFSQTPTYKGYEFHITLKRGPVNKSMGLSRFLEAVEVQIFQGLDWIREVKTDSKEVVSEISHLAIGNMPVEISYQVRSPEVVDASEIWRDAIKRQAEIWLFDCHIKLAGI